LRTGCLNNLRQVGLAMFFYVDSNEDTFPGHRVPNVAESRTSWWGAFIFDYKPDSNVFHCPTLGYRQQTDRFEGTTLVRWKWNFDAHNVGYGYNGFFLGLHPYGPTRVQWIESKPWFKMSAVRSPSENLVIGDTNPKPDGMWSSSLWWPFSGQETREGINTTRHGGVGVILFNDGHAETRKENKINPPRNPASSGDASFIENWDPLQRRKP
jgi:prepilin-type processing-associated H-X9-DG protein